MAGFHDSPGAQRRGRSRFYNDGVAANQRGRHLPAWNRAGEIPWGHEANDAYWLADCGHVDALAVRWNQQTGQPRALAAEGAKDIDGPPPLALRFRRVLHVFARHRGGL